MPLRMSLLVLTVLFAIKQAHAQEYVIRFSNAIDARTDITSQAALLFQKEVESQSAGRIKLQLFFGSQLGTLPAITDQMKDGTIQMNTVGFPFLAKYVPDVQALGLPFLFKDADEAHRTIDGPLGDEVKRVVRERAGIHILGVGEFGFVSILNSRHPIRDIADVKGLRIRTTPSPIAIATFRQLGAVPVAMDFAETYTGLQRGAIDGTDQALSTIFDAKFYEVAKYLTQTRHFFQAMCFNMNEAFFVSLPPDLQAVVQQAGIAAQNYNRTAMADKEVQALAALKAKGVDIIDLTPAEFAAFRKAVDPVYADARTKFSFGPDGIRWVDALTGHN